MNTTRPEPLTLQQWAEKYDRVKHESETRVVAACECNPDNGGYDGCHGWVLTYRDAIYPYETVLAPAQRTAVGLPVPDPYAHLNRGIFDDLQ